MTGETMQTASKMSCAQVDQLLSEKQSSHYTSQSLPAAFDPLPSSTDREVFEKQSK